MVQRGGQGAVGLKGEDARLDAGGGPEGRGLYPLVQGEDARLGLRFAGVGVQHHEVVVRGAGHQPVGEDLTQRLADQPQQLVPAGEAVLGVVEAHGVHVAVDQHGRLALHPQGVHPLLAELAQVVDVGQARQGIGVKGVLLEQAIALDHPGNLFLALAHVRIAEQGQLRAVRHDLPLADGVEIVIAVGVAGAEQHVVVALVAGKGIADALQTADVVRVHPLKLALREPGHRHVAGLAHQLAEAVGHQQRHHLAVDVLIVDQRDGLGLQNATHVVGEDVQAAHGLPPSECDFIRISYHTFPREAMQNDRGGRPFCVVGHRTSRSFSAPVRSQP